MTLNKVFFKIIPWESVTPVTLLFWFSQDSLYLYCYPSAVIREKAMAPHSSTLAWKIPWTEEPRRLQSTGSLRVGHD